MIDGMLSIKEYAEINKKSVQAVYKQIRSKENAKALEGHIFTKRANNKDAKFLDAVAIQILDSASRQAPTVIVKTEDHSLIEQLTQENKNLLIKVAQLQEVIISKSEKIEQLQEANILLLEEKQKEVSDAALEELDKKKGWLRKFFD